MAGAPPTDDQMRSFLQARGDSDLMFIFSEAEIPLVYQYNLVQAGYTNIRRFIGMDSTNAGVRTALKDILGLDPAVDPSHRLPIAVILSAWSVATEQLSHEVKLRAEAKALRQPRPVQPQEKQSMRRVVEMKYGTIPDAECPGNSYLTEKLEEVELNEQSASPLDEVLSVEDLEVQSLGAGLDVSGRLLIVHKKSKGKMPQDAEQFRRKLRIERNLWLLISARYSNRAWLNNLEPGDFDKFTDYFLGDKVYNIGVTEGGVEVKLNPPFLNIIAYEFQCRKKAFKLTRDSQGTVTLKEALLEVVKDSELKEMHFTSPLMLASRKRTADPSWSTSSSSKGEGKGKGKKGRGKPVAKAKSVVKGSKAKGKGKGLEHKTPDGRSICFAYSNNDEGCPGNCGRVHCCRVKGCFALHPTFEHPETA